MYYFAYLCTKNRKEPKTMKRIITLFATVLCFAMMATAQGSKNTNTASDYKSSPEYISLRNAMHRAFNDGDSAQFAKAIQQLKKYLLQQKDLHAYYTQRCNEIVFELNRQNIYEAYMLAINLSRELTERKLDKEMYMAINMMGHIYHFSGNNASAKRCFWEVIRRMEQEGYLESIPPIYMNLVNIVIEEDPDEALRLIEQAASIARESSPEREFDIETRRTLAYYRMGDMERFDRGYHEYLKGEAQGLSSVHGRSLVVYHLVEQGKIDEAIKLSNETLDDRYTVMAEIYASAGRWKEAFEVQKKDMAETDSVNSLLLSSSLQGIQNEVERYEQERLEARRHLYAVVAIAVLLLLLVLALVYIVQTRHRHLREMRKAYQRAIESDKMKTVFIQNVSHEVRTPLNVISGFAQVMADPNRAISADEYRYMSDMVVHNSNRITLMLDEVLLLSSHESAADEDAVPLCCNEFLRKIVTEFHLGDKKNQQIKMNFESELSDDQIVNIHIRGMRLIVLQLLDNAVKNTTNGTVTLKVSIADSQLRVAVEDTGIGVPPGEVDHIFERFVKLDPFKEGLGIGLPFSRTMAQRFGGNVYLDMTYVGPGARFVLALPL